MATHSPGCWGGVSKSFHWLIVLLIAATVPAGYLMAYTYALAFKAPGALPLHVFASQIHHTLGLTILLLAAARLAWRVRGPAPAPASSHFAGQRRLAALTHVTLYALLFALPLSGWMALSVYGQAPIWLFNLKGVVPAILPTLPLKSRFGYGFFAHIHVWALWAGAALVSVHAAAALWHHFVVRDDVLMRMWPLARAREAP